ncbi:MAG: flagellar biosynthesis anti-sigma factor FlgM [Pseudomonadota bacterium]|nr:flagellar biosynthesis anti-sigma factor FlgM [Pseudomonadota bacterium]HJO35825.1 flagellar biosynthesis anti-sigma factor FlgM [Gammaproteobacteria bacterium]
MTDIRTMPPIVPSDPRVSPGAAPQQETAPAAARAAGAGADEVQLTDEGRLMQRLENAVRQAPEVDQARVEQIQRQIAEGTYAADAGRIADRLISAEREKPGG